MAGAVHRSAASRFWKLQQVQRSALIPALRQGKVAHGGADGGMSQLALDIVEVDADLKQTHGISATD